MTGLGFYAHLLDSSAMDSDSNERVRARLTIRGAVQGVGFRPCVFRLASELGLAGWVNNTSQGVTVELEGSRASVDSFFSRIDSEKPPLSFIESIETVWLSPVGADRFEIRESDSEGLKTALILPDIATCAECLRDISDPTNRRYGYPFTNCTHCGPRFSILEAVPYDRANTSMRGFVMCGECRREYDDPADRRFHAQPNACPTCGPHLEWWDKRGRLLASHGDALATAADAITRGSIVAVKGLGGFHLMVDARNEEAVRRLRELKHREEKPFAVMAPSLQAALGECEVSGLEERLLLSPEAPIVLLRHRQAGASIAASVAPGNPFLGVMLPYTPLHHLLLDRLGFAVVATSGNRSDEPICTDERDAVERLAGIADFFLVHNRPIVRHVDDSVVRVMMGRELVIRRARGYAPLPIRLKNRMPCTLAVGAHLKNTVALSKGECVFISQHLGDLETAPAFAAFEAAIRDAQRLYETQPEIIAADAHPDYLPTKTAVAMAAQTGARLITVQHHHAHVLSCMAENEIAPPALGVCWDGTGYGLDGTIWGGEFLAINEDGFGRFAHLRTFLLPGGEAAAREPRRSALGILYGIFGDDVFGMSHLAPVRAFSKTELGNLHTMLRRNANTPRTSSMGRLFDAVASLTGLRQVASFEGQAAMELEFAIGQGTGNEALAFSANEEAGMQVIDWEPMIRDMLSRLQAGVPLAKVAELFHNTLVEMILQIAHLSGQTQIVLSGGCFQNEYLATQTVDRLEQQGFLPVWHRRVPPNDGGIALGQIAAVAKLT